MYPKWKYHRTEAPKVVNDEQEEKDLGEGWEEAPIEAEAAPSKEAGDDHGDDDTKTEIKDQNDDSQLIEVPAVVVDLHHMKEDELIDMLIAKGSKLSKPKLRKKKKAELIKMLEESK